MRQTVIGGFQRTKDFLQDAVGGGAAAKPKPVATATVTPLYPNLPTVPGNPYPAASSYPNQVVFAFEIATRVHCSFQYKMLYC